MASKKSGEQCKCKGKIICECSDPLKDGSNLAKMRIKEIIEITSSSELLDTRDNSARPHKFSFNGEMGDDANEYSNIRRIKHDTRDKGYYNEEGNRGLDTGYEAPTNYEEPRNQAQCCCCPPPPCCCPPCCCPQPQPQLQPQLQRQPQQLPQQQPQRQSQRHPQQEEHYNQQRSQVCECKKKKGFSGFCSKLKAKLCCKSKSKKKASRGKTKGDQQMPSQYNSCDPNQIKRRKSCYEICCRKKSKKGKKNDKNAKKKSKGGCKCGLKVSGYGSDPGSCYCSGSGSGGGPCCCSGSGAGSGSGSGKKKKKRSFKCSKCSNTDDKGRQSTEANPYENSTNNNWGSSANNRQGSNNQNCCCCSPSLTFEMPIYPNVSCWCQSPQEPSCCCCPPLELPCLPCYPSCYPPCYPPCCCCPPSQPRSSGGFSEGPRPLFPQNIPSPPQPLPFACCCPPTNMDNDMSQYDPAGTDPSVRVSVRIRPQNPRELIDMCRICTTVTAHEPQVVLGLDKAFTFDYVFDVCSAQHEIYATCVERLIEGALNGYNATVLAYGQTGSGKTYTMGTGFDRDIIESQQGIIPRAVRHIFTAIEDVQSRENIGSIENVEFSVAAQFLELYNEEIVDLLDPYSKGKILKIHEDGSGQISVKGATIKSVHGPQDALKYLQQGALARTTASTCMNDQSSRSHAIFTILIRRQRVISDEDVETLMSKFHFVDLAGSERLKRTGATGTRAREGISINSGLLALGNCISALGDKSRKATHVPYRDSKLTRLLQDSLGGNSQTLMVACVSPSDRDFMETLNTLKYANRARNIKNKVRINQDQSSRTISQLRREIAALQLELLDFKQGKRLTDAEGNTTLSDTYLENSMLIAENKRLHQRFKAMQETINVLTAKNAELALQKEANNWISPLDTDTDTDHFLTNVVAGYLTEIEKLQAKLIESEEMFQQYKKSQKKYGNVQLEINDSYGDADNLINLAKSEIERNREFLLSRSLPGTIEDTNNYSHSDSDSSDLEEDISGSDAEFDCKANDMQADLNDISSDIEIKTKLIEQLELSKQRIENMRQHYEEKLNILTFRITSTQKERDEVLANLSTRPSSQANDNVKRVRDDYEKKINEIQRELRKLQQAQRAHERQQQEIKTQEVKLQNLRQELTELKNIKARLMKKLNEQTTRHKEESSRKAREIAQLRKEQRRQQSAVKTLQAQVHAKDQILKRKTEEVSALRHSFRSSFNRKEQLRLKKEQELLDSHAVKRCWEQISRALLRVSRNKKAIVKFEKELERLMNERETLSHEFAQLKERQQSVKHADLVNEEDTIKSNLNYVQDSIAYVQQTIMELEDGKSSVNNDMKKLQTMIKNVRNTEEAKFLLEHLLNNTIMVFDDCALAQNSLAEYQAQLKEVQQESIVQQQLLQHFIDRDNALQISDLFQSFKINEMSGSQKSLNSSGTYDIPSTGNMTESFSMAPDVKSCSPPDSSISDFSQDKVAKVRRRTAHPQDLLFGPNKNDKNSDVKTLEGEKHITRNIIPIIRVPSAPGAIK